MNSLCRQDVMPVIRWGMCLVLGAVCLVLAWVNLAGAAAEPQLVRAAKDRDEKTVQALLETHADVNARQADGATALHWAAHWDDLQVANLLIRSDANVNAATELGITPLSLACENGSAQMVDALLNAGAAPNATTAYGETVLMACVQTGSVEAVQSLLARGANVNAREPERGQTALMRAAAENHAGVVRALLAHGAEINARSSALNLVDGRYGAPGAPGVGPMDVPSGYTPILFAANRGAIDTARVLLDNGANVNDMSALSDSPITLGEHRISTGGASVLLVAVYQGHWESARLLLDRGADPNLNDGAGFSPLHWMSGRWETGHGPLRPSNYKRQAAVGPGKLEMVKHLLARGADANARLAMMPIHVGYTTGTRMALRGATPFVLAAHAGDAAVMRALVDAGADPSLTTDDHTTALIAAAGYGRVQGETQTTEAEGLEAAKLALELGSEIRAANDKGETALHGAAYWGMDGMVQFLVDHGADVNAWNKAGQTPLSLAEGHADSSTGANLFSWPSMQTLLRQLGGVNTVELEGTVVQRLADCPELIVRVQTGLNPYTVGAVGKIEEATVDGGIPVWTNEATRYTNAGCADITPGAKVLVKGVNRVTPGGGRDGSVSAVEIRLAQ